MDRTALLPIAVGAIAGGLVVAVASKPSRERMSETMLRM